MNRKFGAFSSSQDLNKLSLTVKAIVVGLLPVFHAIIGIEIFSENIDKVIDSVFVLFTTYLAIKGYIRSKHA